VTGDRSTWSTESEALAIIYEGWNQIYREPPGDHLER